MEFSAQVNFYSRVSSKFKIIKLAEADVRDLHDLRINKNFLNKTPKPWQKRLINGTSLKVRTSVSITEIKRVKRQATDGETILVVSIANKGLLSRVCKILKDRFF